MSYEVEVKTKTKVSYLKADMGVRYWEDASVNGVEEDDANPKMPFASSGAWNITINLATGAILNWPKGVTAETHYKVCDAGVYSLLDHTMESIVSKDGYVPDMLAPGGAFAGDYVVMKIDGDGVIENWNVDLSYFEDEE